MRGKLTIRAYIRIPPSHPRTHRAPVAAAAGLPGQVHNPEAEAPGRGDGPTCGFVCGFVCVCVCLFGVFEHRHAQHNNLHTTNPTKFKRTTNPRIPHQRRRPQRAPPLPPLLLLPSAPHGAMPRVVVLGLLLQLGQGSRGGGGGAVVVVGGVGGWGWGLGGSEAGAREDEALDARVDAGVESVLCWFIGCLVGRWWWDAHTGVETQMYSTPSTHSRPVTGGLQMARGCDCPCCCCGCSRGTCKRSGMPKARSLFFCCCFFRLAG